MPEEDGGRLPWDKCLQYAIALFVAFVGTFTAVLVAAWKGVWIVIWIWLPFGCVLLGGTLVLIYWSYIRHPSRAGKREEHKRQRQLEQARERERGKWKSALEIVVRQHKDDRVSFDPLFFRTGPVGYGPDGMILFVRLAGVEVVNNYRHTVRLQEIAVRVFSQATEKEIVPTEIRTLTVEGDMQIKARSRQQYKIQVQAFFGGVVRTDGTELFLTVMTAEHASLRAKLNLLSVDPPPPSKAS